MPNEHDLDRTEQSTNRRLRQAEDRLEIFQLEGAYGPAYDGRQGATWAALFTTDGVYRGRRLDGMAEQNFVRGRENLARFCEDQPMSGVHFMHLPHIVLDGDTATARVHHQFQGADVDGSGRAQLRLVTGYYDVAYVRTDEGWRIRDRVTNYLEASRSSFYSYSVDVGDLGQPAASEPDYRDCRS